jgi:hypothetical protein
LDAIVLLYDATVGAHGSGVGQIDDVPPLRRKLTRKADHYGDLGKPYAIAVLCAGTFVPWWSSAGVRWRGG